MMASLPGFQRMAYGLTHGLTHAVPQVPAAELDKVMLLGFLSSFLALVCYFHRDYSRAFELGLGLGLAGMAGYAFLQDAWPIGIAEAIWSVRTLSRCGKRRAAIPTGIRITRRSRVDQPAFHWEMESRLTRMFGRN